MNFAVYFAATMLTAAFEIAYGAKMSNPVLIMKSKSPTAVLIVITLAKDFSEALRNRGRKTLIVLITPRTLTLNWDMLKI